MIELGEKIPPFNKEIRQHLFESKKGIEYYAFQYSINLFLDPISSSLLPNMEHLMRATLQTFLTYPIMTYFNNLWDKNINNIQSNEATTKNLREILLCGLKTAYIGPGVALWAKYALPPALGEFINCLIANMIRNTTAYVFFHDIKDIKTFCSILPSILIVGAIGGVIFFYASSTFQNSGFNPRDCFYLSMMVKRLFDPQIKKIEKLTIDQLLTRNFSAA
ncbi:hypothetical protein AYO37_00330 [Opitutia bacterium SCGC AG-212-L18]|nr:hypothetical protein AYO37_00330 [Opitutae bacterium SCGC AG-212-L18]